MNRHRPPRPFLRAQWRDLVMLNYEAPRELLEPLVPSGVELDRWRGRLYVSVVGFRFLDARVLGIAVPGHRHFEEVNLRFYVRRGSSDETRRGVVFIRELVHRPAIAWVARLLYNEPYRAVPMRHRIESLPDASERSFAWRADGAWTTIHARTLGPARPLEPESEEEFITEHYWGYTRQRDGGTIEYRVEHPRWNVWTATAAHIEGDVSRVYGNEFARILERPAISAFVADGSPVTVFAPERIR